MVNKNILIAEDNPINQQILEVMIDSLGLNADIANDGNIATSMYEKNNYDLIFMDINMPNCGGIEATKKIRELSCQQERNHIPIIALTADNKEESIALYKKEGMDEYMNKPINFDKLKHTIEKFLV